MYDTILAPTDGSACANAALEHALDLASHHGSTLHALSVVDATQLGLFTPSDAELQDVKSSLRARAEDAVATATARGEDADVSVITAVRVGVPHRVIQQYVEGEGVDLVVIGTHGRTGVEHALLGSVAERVVRTATVPVLTVRAARAGD